MDIHLLFSIRIGLIICFPSSLPDLADRKTSRNPENTLALTGRARSLALLTYPIIKRALHLGFPLVSHSLCLSCLPSTQPKPKSFHPIGTKSGYNQLLRAHVRAPGSAPFSWAGGGWGVSDRDGCCCWWCWSSIVPVSQCRRVCVNAVCVMDEFDKSRYLTMSH